MSSAFLYLAIVAVWAVVLVPMWLRRDSEATGISRLLHKRPDEDGVELDTDQVREHLPEDDELIDPEEPSSPQPDVTAGSEPGDVEVAEPSVHRRPGRAAVIARRRRRTVGLTLLVLTAVTVAAVGLAPWWITPPPVLLLVGHLTLLRVAVQMDQARARQEAEAARLEAERLATERAEAEIAQEIPEPSAEVLEFVGRPEDEVFDQYAEEAPTTEDRRAVGE
ncbi:hypothetical protein DZF91_00765 [Actinomadura logoneensis]|uniref:Uncharacterized protein n=1 Tax=Actinomadura logoneensis TaxID=2293572 RepID=A0A372JU67_9ACTN|nr:hypothetical protein [Actinomadura logoneensis]RFU43510.1 hypothetical protein DZF91_00765 [Actinomadura logoneensis]